jgi:septal ring factor EnvC (AmiA/AmiB activator)
MAPKLILERVMEQFKEFAVKLLDEIAEPRSLILVVDWQVGSDFPPGLLVTRGEVAGPQLLIEASNQLTKMNLRVLEVYANALSEAREVNDELAQQVTQLQNLHQQLKQEVEDLERRKYSLTGKTTDGTVASIETDRLGKS